MFAGFYWFSYLFIYWFISYFLYKFISKFDFGAVSWWLRARLETDFQLNSPHLRHQSHPIKTYVIIFHCQDDKHMWCYFLLHARHSYNANGGFQFTFFFISIFFSLPHTCCISATHSTLIIIFVFC